MSVTLYNGHFDLVTVIVDAEWPLLRFMALWDNHLINMTKVC